MSAFVVIAEEPRAPKCILWMSSGMLIAICQFLKASVKNSAKLGNDSIFCKALEFSNGDVLDLEMCSESVLAEVASLLFGGANSEHEYWQDWKSSLPHSEIRPVFKSLAQQIVQSLEASEQRRDALCPKQRLCAALRFRAESGMRDFLRGHGLESHELATIKKRIDRGEWPPFIMEFVPLPAWKKRIARRMAQINDPAKSWMISRKGVASE
jgi:hypothetical protein